MAQGAGEESPSTASRVEQDFAGMRVDAVHHERGNGAWRIIFSRITGALQVVQDLLVNVAEMLTLGEVIEVDSLILFTTCRISWPDFM